MDTGAQINLIKDSFCQGRLGVVKGGIGIKGINGRSLTKGLIHLKFSIGNGDFGDAFHIVEDSCLGKYDIFLGLNFFVKNGCLINYAGMFISGEQFECPIEVDDVVFIRSAVVEEINSVTCGNFDGASPVNIIEVNFSPVAQDNLIKFRHGHLSSENYLAISDILLKYPDVFEDLTADNLPELTFESLNLTSTDYIQTRIYRFPPVHNELVKKEMEKLLDLNIISHSKSPYNSPVWIVPKKDGENGEKQFRIVIDYRKLNKVTVQDNFPLPRIDDIIDQLGGAQYFSVMDLASGFHQIALRPEDHYKTAFTVLGNHYEFKRLPFGLINSAPAFQRIMNQVLGGLIGEICFVYIDDIVVYGRDLMEHNRNLEIVLDRLSKNKLKVKPAKCHFLKEEVGFLGFRISRAGIGMDPKKTEAIKNFVAPTNVKQLRSFLGLAGFYRKHIPNFSKIANPLHVLLKDNVVFEWNDECVSAFNKLIETISKDIVLQFPDFDKTFYLTTDASNFGLGAVLSQKDENGFDCPLAFISRSINSAEINYTTTEKECLAIVWGVLQFRHYLTGRKFVILSDHRPLVWLDSVIDPGARLLRWRLKLNNYNYELQYTPGKTNYVADELSRNCYNNCPTSHYADELIVPAIAQIQVDFGGQGDTAEEDEEVHEELDFCPRDHRDKITDVNQINELIREQHCGPIGGHRGINATEKAINIYFEITNLREMVTDFIKNCDVCQRVKYNRQHRALPLMHTSTASEPNEKIAFDVIGPFKYPDGRKLYGLTIQDEFTKFIMFCGIKDCVAETIAKALVESWILYYGIPKFLLSDNGSNLCGEVMTAISTYFNIKRITTSVAHPQSNGSVERAHGRLAEFIRATDKEIAEDVSWESRLRLASFCYNNTVHATTGYTPYFLMFGRKPRLISGVALTSDDLLADSYLSRFNSNLKSVWERARKNIDDKKLEAINRENKKILRRKVEDFKVGDLILVSTPTFKGRVNRTEDVWMGPYKVVEVRDTNVSIKKRNRNSVINKANCKVYQSPS